jgi:hypothetical protein
MKAYDSVRREILYSILIEIGVPMKLGRMIKMCLKETYNKVCIGKYLPDNFPIQNGLKQGDALFPLLLNSALEYIIRKVQKNQVGLKLNGTHQLLVYVDGVNVLEDNVSTIKKNTETVIDASKEIVLEVNTEKTKYMVLSRQQNAGQNHDIKIANRSFENMAQLKYFRTTVINQNLIRKKLRGNPCYHLVQKLLSSHLLSKNVKIRIYKTIILPVVVYGCETWSLTLREEHRLRMFENRGKGPDAQSCPPVPMYIP